MPKKNRRPRIPIGLAAATLTVAALTVTTLATIGPAGAPATDPGAAPAARISRAAAAVPGPYLTLLFSRTELGANDKAPDCVLDTRRIARLDTVVAPFLAARGRMATGSLQTGVMLQSTSACIHSKRTAAASWDVADTLARTYGWRFVSHSASYPLSFSGLSDAQKQAETCGSRDTIRAHGLPGAEGLFAWPNNSWNDADQARYVAPCFAFGRQYALRAGVTTLADAVTEPYFQHTATVSGGACNDPTQTCSSIRPDGAPNQHYDLPSTFIRKLATLKPGQWYTLQNYLLVTGTNPPYSTNPSRWDCRSTDPAQHWTNDTERYCWNDYQAIVRAIPATVTVTDPLTVAHAFGRPGY